MTEFDDLMKSLMDEKEVPNELNRKLKKRLNNKYKFNKARKAIPTSLAVCLVVGVVLGVVMYKNDKPIQLPIENAPLVANIKTTKEVQPYASVSECKSSDRIFTLNDYLNDDELILLVSEKIKEMILNSSDGIEYFDEFSRISGNERFYLTENNELIIIFDPGVLAKEENGEIYFNVGIIK